MNNNIKPDDFRRLPQVSTRTGLPRSTIYRLIQESKFPAPFKLAGSRISVWSNNALTDWIEEQKQKAGVS